MHDVQNFKAISRSIRPDQKRAMSRALPQFLARGGLRAPPHLVRQHAVSALKQVFAQATRAEIDALTVDFLGRVAVALRGTTAEASDMADLSATDQQAMTVRFQQSADSLSDMGEMESLRRQMQMDRRSKFMSTLSNLMKAIADTQSAIAANLK